MDSNKGIDKLQRQEMLIMTPKESKILLSHLRVREIPCQPDQYPLDYISDSFIRNLYSQSLLYLSVIIAFQFLDLLLN